MANYIEREDDNLSSNDTVVSDSDISNTEDSEFLDRWDWLLSGTS